MKTSAHRANLTRILCTLLLLCASVALSAQTPSPQAKTFADEPYIVQSLSSITTMNADGTGTRLQTISLRIQSDAALRQFGVVNLIFASQSERVELLYARVLRPDGATLETPPAEAIDQPAPVTREAPFYSDIQTRQLPIKNLRIGDTLQWQARFTTTHPEIPGQFWGQDSFITGAVVLDEFHELRVPQTLHPTVWTNPRDAASFSEASEDGQHIYRWRHADLKPTVGAAAEAARLAEESRLLTADEELDATKGKLPSFAWTTFPSWAAVGAWYGTLAADRTTPDAAIRAKVAELTAGKSTDLAKAQALYHYVSTQIRYIGVDFGIGRYQPHSAAEVLANQYGDCKDKHTLLASMLSVAGLHADPVLIGAGIRFNPSVPSPAAFNHLITRLSLDGQEVWLDSTAEVAPWRALSYAIRDQDALVIPASSPASIVRTPADLPYPAYETSVATGSLDPSLTSDSRIILTLRDDDEIVIRSVLRNVSPSNYGVFVQQLMQNLGFGGTTSEPSIEHLDDSSQPLTISFHYHRVKEKDWGENRITALFQPIPLPSFTAQKPPIASIQLGIPRTVTSTLEMALPPGWSAELPEAVHAHTAFANCDVTYRVEAGKLIAERRLVILKSKVPVADYKQYQAWYDSAGVSGTPYIQLIAPPGPANLSFESKNESKNEAPANGKGDSDKAPDSATPASNPQAAELVQKAGDNIRAMDPDGARKLLDQAKALNPSERGLWMGYAAIDSQLGKSDEAVQDLRNELAYFPDEVKIYHWLAMQKLQNHDQQGAIVSLRQWVKSAPNDPDAALALVQQLQAARQYDAELTEAQAAITRIGTGAGDLIALKLAVAEAQMQLGYKKEAAALFEPLLKAATDPGQINDIAYNLAEIGTDLPDADAAQRKALAALDAQSTGFTLTEAPLLLVRKQSLLAAAWDTMGWILYREGSYSEALGYIKAALHTQNSSVVREHLTAIATALHNPAAAAYAKQTDQQLRTIPLGPAKGRHGTAELRLLIADGKAVGIGPPAANAYTAPGSGDFTPALPGAAEMVKAADLHSLVPPGSNAHLVRSGFVTCHGTVCELVLSPLGAGPG